MASLPNPLRLGEASPQRTVLSSQFRVVFKRDYYAGMEARWLPSGHTDLLSDPCFYYELRKICAYGVGLVKTKKAIFLSSFLAINSVKITSNLI